MIKKWRQIEGKNPILEALRAGNKIFKIFLAEGIRRDEKIGQILSLACAREIPIIKKGWRNLQRLSCSKIHQGIIAQAAPLDYFSLRQILQKCEESKKDPLIVILPQILYEYNLGAVVRTAEAVGVDCLVVSKKNRLGPLVARASMGAIEYLPIVVQNLFSALSFLKKSGLKIFAAEAKSGEIYFKTDLTGPLALIVGGDDKGISWTFKKYIDVLVRIPMKGQINSLNLSVATGVILYEAFRQRSVKRCP